MKLQLAFVKEENDRLRNDLADLTKLSEMLNVKFKLMSHEKEKLKEQSEEFTFSFQDARDQVHELSCKYNSKLFIYLFIYLHILRCSNGELITQFHELVAQSGTFWV